MEQIVEWFDVVWFWFGRGLGSIILFVLALGIFMMILEKVWPLFGWIKACFLELKSVADYLKWKRSR